MFRRVQVDYSITRLFSVGLAYRPLPKCEIEGYRHVKTYSEYGYNYGRGIDHTGEFQGGPYYLLASLWPIPNGFTAKSTGKLSLGFGLADLRQTFRADSAAVMKKRPLSLTVAAEFDYFLNRNISLGLDIDYAHKQQRGGRCRCGFFRFSWWHAMFVIL